MSCKSFILQHILIMFWRSRNAKQNGIEGFPERLTTCIPQVARHIFHSHSFARRRLSISLSLYRAVDYQSINQFYCG